MSTLFDPANESMRTDMLEQVQLERLQVLLARLKRNVRRYRENLGDLCVQELSDLTELPFMSAEDLLDAFPYDMFALPLREVIRLHSITSLEGKQLVIGHTRNDLVHWSRLTARQLVAAGVTSHDVIQTSIGASCIGQSLGYMLGAELIEASVIPEDTFHIEYHLQVLQNYRTTVLVTTPTNATDLVQLLRSERIDPQSLQLRTVLLTRPADPELYEELKAGLFAEVRSNFGIPEITDPGFCLECEEGNLHVNEDHFIVETDNGELVVTTLCREAMPLLRYRTGIACTTSRSACPCGRQGIILHPGKRLDGRLRVNEMPLYEEQIAGVLSKTEAAGQPFHIDMSEHSIHIGVEVSEALFGDKMLVLANLRERIKTEFLLRLGIPCEVSFVSPSMT